MSIFGNIAGKIAGSTVGMWFAGNRLLVVGIVVAVIGGGATWYVYGAQTAKGKVSTLQNELKHVKNEFWALQVAVDLNADALNECRELNRINEIALREKEQKVQAGLTTILLLQTESKHTVKDIRNEADKLRNRDTECRTVDEPFPDWFTVGLW